MFPEIYGKQFRSCVFCTVTIFFGFFIFLYVATGLFTWTCYNTNVLERRFVFIRIRTALSQLCYENPGINPKIVKSIFLGVKVNCFLVGFDCDKTQNFLVSYKPLTWSYYKICVVHVYVLIWKFRLYEEINAFGEAVKRPEQLYATNFSSCLSFDHCFYQLSTINPSLSGTWCNGSSWNCQQLIAIGVEVNVLTIEPVETMMIKNIFIKRMPYSRYFFQLSSFYSFLITISSVWISYIEVL